MLLAFYDQKIVTEKAKKYSSITRR